MYTVKGVVKTHWDTSFLPNRLTIKGQVLGQGHIKDRRFVREEDGRSTSMADMQIKAPLSQL